MHHWQGEEIGQLYGKFQVAQFWKSGLKRDRGS